MHEFTASDSIAGVACSNLGSTWGIADLSSMYPFVTAYKDADFGTPWCGKCVATVGSTGTTVYLTIVDQVLGGSAFDIAPESFTQLFGAKGNQDGKGDLKYTVVEGSKCQGNKG